jgi:pimeloyl-ACP methyl ester carboxylesterase
MSAAVRIEAFLAANRNTSHRQTSIQKFGNTRYLRSVFSCVIAGRGFYFKPVFFSSTVKRKMNNYKIISTESHIVKLKLAITHKAPAVLSNDYPVLMLHGASFPSTLAFCFRMGNYSWMDNLVENGYDVYSLDFWGYGNSDRCPEMDVPANTAPGPTESAPVGIAVNACKYVDKAVDLIIRRTGLRKVNLIAHSWGGTVAALYTENFPEKVAKLVLFTPITPRPNSSALEATKGA